MNQSVEKADARLPMPPEPLTGEGQPRRLGVELEFTGVDVSDVADIVAACVSGSVERRTDYEIDIVGDDDGDWTVEVDFELLKEMGRKTAERKRDARGDNRKNRDDEDASLPLAEETAALFDAAGDFIEELLDRTSQPLVPTEVVSPPIPLAALHRVNTLIARLREAGALGTSERWFYAFGLHMNPELPGLDASTINRYLKAYFCLSDWLTEQAGVDLTRRLTPYIDPFPAAYRAKVVNPDYQPDRAQLIDDYLEDNPTRNRSLDMLPLFSHLDSNRVKTRVDDPRVKSRPTFHYRLPNCEIDRDDWDITGAWRGWLQVEHLACDPIRLDTLCRRCLAHLGTGSSLLPARPFEVGPDDLTEL